MESQDSSGEGKTRVFQPQNGEAMLGDITSLDKAFYYEHLRTNKFL